MKSWELRGVSKRKVCLFSPIVLIWDTSHCIFYASVFLWKGWYSKKGNPTSRVFPLYNTINLCLLHSDRHSSLFVSTSHTVDSAVEGDEVFTIVLVKTKCTLHSGCVFSPESEKDTGKGDRELAGIDCSHVFNFIRTFSGRTQNCVLGGWITGVIVFFFSQIDVVFSTFWWEFRTSEQTHISSLKQILSLLGKEVAKTLKDATWKNTNGEA